MSDLCSAMEKFGKGVGTPSRYRIVEALFKGPKTVGELVKAVRQSQPAVSQHLKILKGAGLVVDERRGKEVLYALDAGYILGLLKSLSVEVHNKKKIKRS
jgi:ArsR family transcriptional regulator, nickel/cobalt-responsive transcriptional repressor